MTEINTDLDVEVTNEKPYNQCIKCRHLGVRCDGPNFAAMTPDRLVEWCRLRKEYLGWSNAKLADEADNTPKGTVDRILSGGHADFKVSTISPIIKALVGGSWGQFPCPDPDNAPPETKELVEILKNKDAELQKIRADMDALSEDHQRTLQHSEEDNRRRVDYLKELVAKHEETIKTQSAKIEKQEKALQYAQSRNFWTAVAVAALASIIAVALVIDRLNPNIGFLWLG